MPVPVISSSTATRLTQSSAYLKGFDSSFDSTNRGFVWGLEADPTVADNLVEPAIYGLGSPAPFYATVEDLPEGTVIYWRAWAVNGSGNAYGETKTFTTLRAIPPHRRPAETPALADVICGGACSCSGEPIARELAG